MAKNFDTTASTRLTINQTLEVGYFCRLVEEGAQHLDLAILLLYVNFSLMREIGDLPICPISSSPKVNSIASCLACNIAFTIKSLMRGF